MTNVKEVDFGSTRSKVRNFLKHIGAPLTEYNINVMIELLDGVQNATFKAVIEKQKEAVRALERKNLEVQLKHAFTAPDIKEAD